MIGVSAAAAVIVFRNASAILSGIKSGDHSTGLGTPGNAFRSSELIRVSSLNASGSALAPDERLGLKPAVSPPRRRASRSRTRGRSPAIAQQICHANQFGPGLRAEFVGQLCLVPRERLERAAAIARPCPRLHDSANPLFRERVEILQASGVAFYRREVANPPRGGQLPHEAIAELGR